MREPMSKKANAAALGCAVLAVGLLAAACTHTVRVEAPKDPIVINLNVKIDQEVRVRLAEDIDRLIDANPDIF